MACYPNSMDAADLHHSSHHKELGEQMDSGLEPLTVTVQVKYIFKDRGVLRKRKFLIPIISFSSSLKDPKPGLTSVSEFSFIIECFSQKQEQATQTLDKTSLKQPMDVLRKVSNHHHRVCRLLNIYIGGVDE